MTRIVDDARPALLSALCMALTVGCSSGIRDYMPLGPNDEWEYEVHIDFVASTEMLRVARPAPVGSIEGWLLESGMGDSRMAWDGDVLLAAELAGTVYAPPIPLLATGDKAWRGVVMTTSSRTAGTARLQRSDEKLHVGIRDYDCAKTVLTLESSGETVQLTTWFFPGLGILRQEQRRGPQLERDRLLVFVSGP